MNKKVIAVIGAAVLGIVAISCSSKIMKMANALDSVPPYMETLSFEIGVPSAIGVVYSNSTAEGEVLHYIHCGECRTGIIRPESGQCSYCGKVGRAAQ